MSEEQFKNFLYSCQRAGMKFHFNNEDGIGYYLNDDNIARGTTFEGVVAHNAMLLKRLQSGVCFSMSCYVYELLYSMGLEDGYWIMESFDSYWPNTVIIYTSPQGIRICDLAASVRKYEDIIDQIHSLAYLANRHKEVNNNIEAEIVDLTKKLVDTSNLELTVEQYTKNYDIVTCQVLLHHGYESSPYDNVPGIGLKDFLDKYSSSKTNISTTQK